MYIPLFYHSNYGKGGSDFITLFEFLKRYRIPACGIVDDTFFGLYEFLKLTKEYNIKPIIGSRISMGDHDTSDFSLFYLFAKNKTGYTNLCQILTNYAFKKLDMNFIKEHSAGLIFISSSVKAIDELSHSFSDSYFLLKPGSSFVPDRKISVVGGNEIFYVQPEDREIYQLLSVIKKFKIEDGNKKISYLLKPDEFTHFYDTQPDAIKNLFKIAESCSYIPEAEGWIFPEIEKPLIDIIKPFYHKLNGEEKRRLEYEYKIIKMMGFEPYFVLIYELKEFAKTRGIGMNVRGSAASSFILYLLGLSIVNPLKYRLPFERFLNQKRSEPPDIDVDVEFNQREYLINEIYKKFGNDYVVRIGMINRFQTRARFRDSARAFGITPAELRNIEEHSGEHLIGKIFKLSKRIDGYPRGIATHPGGIVIAPEPVFKYVPLYPGQTGPITQFDKEGIGITGLVKLDILGVRGFPELYFRKDEIDFTDSSVYRFIATGNTIGCFQIESPMVRQVLKKIKPESLIEIANAIAIIRPGPAQGGMKEKFLKRLKVKEEIDYPHPVLEDILSETLGIPIYQEQILSMANRFAGFSLEDADILRRAMTKERNSNLMNEIKERFFQQAHNMGYSIEDIEKVWQRISAFSSFGFNKAHSITYATLAYLSAYQKFYNPLEFFCRLLNNGGGYYPLYAYINEARRWGIGISGPDINESEWGFTIKNGLLLTGLGRVRSLSYSTFKRIVEFRPFHDADEFFSLVRPDVEEGLNLIKSGALDLFGEPWTVLYFKLLKTLNSFARIRSTRPDGLFTEYNENLPFLDFSPEKKLEFQLYSLGFLPKKHILEFLYPERTVKISDVRFQKMKVDLIGLVISRRTILARNNRYITFYTVDDETGHLEVIVFRGHRDDQKIILKMAGRFKDDFFYAKVL